MSQTCDRNSKIISSVSNSEIISSELRERDTTSDDLHVRLVNKVKESKKLNALAKCFIPKSNLYKIEANDKHYSFSKNRDHMFVTHIYIMFSLVLAFFLIYLIIRNATPTCDPPGNLEIPSELNPHEETVSPGASDFVSICISPHTNLTLTSLRPNSNVAESPLPNKTPIVRDTVTTAFESSVTNMTPIAQNVRTPIVRDTATTAFDGSVMNMTPIAQNIRTPIVRDTSSDHVNFDGISSLSTSSSEIPNFVCNDTCEGAFLNVERNLEKYLSNEFIDKSSVNQQEVSQVLRQLRTKNINKVIIGHLNVNFFAPKLDAIRTIAQGNLDIMVFSETKLDGSYPMAQLLIDGYRKPFRLDRNANGGGLLIYVRSDIPCKQLEKHEFSENIEGIIIEVNLRKSKWLLVGTYHPPSQNDSFYFENIERALNVYSQTYDKFLLVGDFNAEEKEVILSNFMASYSLRNLVKENTCFKSVVNPSCVDLFLTNAYKSFQTTQTVSTGISDFHKMIVTVLKTTFKKAKPREILYRSYKNYDDSAFKEDLKCKLVDCNNYTEYEKRFVEVVNTHAPIKKRLVRANEVPYMTKALRKAIANRSRLEHQYYKYKTAESLKMYKQQKNFCSRLYKKERKKYYENLDVKKVTDSKKFWKTVKPFLSDKNAMKTDIVLVEGDNIIQEDQEVAKTFSDFFSNAVKSLNLNIPVEHLNIESDVADDLIDNILSKYSGHPSVKLINDNVIKGNFSFHVVTSTAVEKEVAALDTRKASMTSSIPPIFLKDNSSICCKPLTGIINDGISNSTFDRGLKLADLTPVHKAEDTVSKKNYRNISLLPVVSKIFEKLLQGQISNYVEKYLSVFLCGYRKGYSAQHALLTMLEKWRISLDKGGFGGGVLMDLSKAFDTLDHDLLIAKLHAYGFSKNALRLIKSYLTDRWQRVKINTSYSSWSELLSGVPQGSVLGPLLFNLYINDLFYIIMTDICNYADDTTPYTVDISLDSLMAKLEGASNTAMEWFRNNGMQLNSRKCHLLVCGHKFESMILKIENAQVIETHLVKLLGVKIESELTFKKHMENICKKASQKLNALARICAFLPFHKRRILMHAFFNSQFSYSPLVWMFHSRELNTRINNLHYRALRIIYLDETSSFVELLQKDGSVIIHHRNLQCLAIEMFKVKMGLAPAFLNDVFTTNENVNTENVSSNTRSKSCFYDRLNPKSVRYGLETLRSLGPRIWKMIPVSVRETQSLSVFKSRIKKWIPLECPCRQCKTFIPKIGFL